MSQSENVTLQELQTRNGPILVLTPPKYLELGEFMTTEFPPPEDILHPILQRRGSLMIHGPTGIGKTQFAVGLAVACCTGGAFLRYQAKQTVSVLFADFECQAATIQQRLATALSVINKEPLAELRITNPDLGYPNPMPDLATREGQEAFNTIIDDKCDVIFIDNLSTAMRAGAENDPETWVALQDWVLKHRAAGRAVVLIQHEGKKADSGARGHSRQQDILDVVVQLKRPSDFVNSDGARFEVHYRKNRHHTGDSLGPFEAQLADGADGKPAWSMRDIAINNLERAAELFGMGMGPKEVAAELSVSPSQAYRYRKDLGLSKEKS